MPPPRYSDRFIPSRAGSGDVRAAFGLRGGENAAGLCNEAGPLPPRAPYAALLKAELLGATPAAAAAAAAPAPRARAAGAAGGSKRGAGGGRAVGGEAGEGGGVAMPNLFRFREEGGEEEVAPVVVRRRSRGSRGSRGSGVSAGSRGSRGSRGSVGAVVAAAVREGVLGGKAMPLADGAVCVDGGEDYCLGPAGAGRAAAAAAAALSARPRRDGRKVARAPFKVLDAPFLSEDFYLNLVDWSATNVLAVGLASCVYLWSACTASVTKLCDLGAAGPVCSVAWSASGGELAVGTSAGPVQVWDAAACVLLRTMGGHASRVGCLAWSSALLSSGSRDQHVYNRDLRAPHSYVATLVGHSQEVCGLKWSHDDAQLASGGNDNQLLVWSAAKLDAYGAGGGMRGAGAGGGAGAAAADVATSPMLRYSLHVAAVKAIAWSPHARGVLASGGGTADKTIRFWNTVSDTALAAVDTGSQVCNLSWSKNVNEIVSTHGYSQNQIIVWRYPTMSKVVTLTGHESRVLYLAVSPSGETIVTGAGDETLRFWNVFPQAASTPLSSANSLLSPDRMNIR